QHESHELNAGKYGAAEKPAFTSEHIHGRGGTRIDDQARAVVKCACGNECCPPIGPELLGRLVTVTDSAAHRFRVKPNRLGVENTRPVDEKVVRAFAGDIGNDDPLGIRVRHGKRVYMIAGGGELDEWNRGNACPAAAVVPAPLDPRITGVDGENHSGLARTTRPLRINASLPRE